jgi:hypothetical protein
VSPQSHGFKPKKTLPMETCKVCRSGRVVGKHTKHGKNTLQNPKNTPKNTPKTGSGPCFGQILVLYVNILLLNYYIVQIYTGTYFTRPNAHKCAKTCKQNTQNVQMCTKHANVQKWPKTGQNRVKSTRHSICNKSRYNIVRTCCSICI